jgi:thiamine-monophosphate kinase
MSGAGHKGSASPARKHAVRSATARTAARLAAVQALYQMDMTAIDLNRVIAEFEAHRLGQEVEGCQYCDAEAQFFRDIVEGVVREQLRIDPLIDRHLAEGWRLNRVDSILRAILRAGTFEMLIRKDIPSRVVITEYVDLAHAFFEGEEPKVVNGILDKLGHEARPQEFSRQGSGGGKRVERGKRDSAGEFDIIARYFAPLATNPAALGLLDDAAVLSLPEGQELVATCDTVIAGVHFLAGDPPDTIGYKALAASLSDLAAKGARPHVYLLSVAFPKPPASAWLEAFASGIGAAQVESGIDLVGGDTSVTPGPLTITVTAVGMLPQGEAVLRRGAMVGDRLCVSGTIGDAALGLKLLRAPQLAAEWGLSDEDRALLIERYRRPSARNALILPLRQCARAAIDVSDGLVGDTGKLCVASGVGATIEAARVPFSAAAAKAVAKAPDLLAELLTAGDDYEIVAAVEASHAQAFAMEAREHNVAITAIGEVEPGDGQVKIVDGEGRVLALDHTGFSHF